MKLTALIRASVVVATAALMSRAALAQEAPAQPAGAWIPATSSDAAHIVNQAYYVYNTDTSAAHVVVSGSGLSVGSIPGLSAGTYSAEFYGYSNGGSGQAITCWVDVTDLITHNTVETSGSSTTTLGYVAFSVSYTLTTNMFTDPTVMSTKCSIPKDNSNGISFLFAGIINN